MAARQAHAPGLGGVNLGVFFKLPADEGVFSSLLKNAPTLISAWLRAHCDRLWPGPRQPHQRVCGPILFPRVMPFAVCHCLAKN